MKNFLDEIYCAYNKREFVNPDPLQFLYDYKDIRDREIVGLIASSLAYGRVAQIIKSVANVLYRMGGAPRDFVTFSSDNSVKKALAGFKHRFTTGSEISNMLVAVKHAIDEHGSLNKCFVDGYDASSPTVLPALSNFVGELSGGRQWAKGLLPSPEMGSACKRLNLYLRWMVRKDSVDPGGWKGVLPSALVVPLDTHMYKVGRAFKFTKRKAADIKTALEITKAFAVLSPQDPIKYDFALTRFGIRDGAGMKDEHKALANLWQIR